MRKTARSILNNINGSGRKQAFRTTGSAFETEAWERFKLVRSRKENDRARVITLRSRFPRGNGSLLFS